MLSVPRWPGAGRNFRGISAGDGSWVAWRFVGANGWELARSASVFPDVPSCEQAMARLLHTASSTPDSTIFRPQHGTWGWELTVDGEPLAVASRLYQRARDCSRTVELFLQSLPRAAPRPRVPQARSADADPAVRTKP